MKTAEQFLEECKVKWSIKTPENAKKAMIDALILYAEQAIDMCCKESDKVLNGYIDINVSCDNDDAINNVKKLLK